MKHYEDLFELYELGKIQQVRAIQGNDKKVDRALGALSSGAALKKFSMAPLNAELLPGSVNAAKRLNDLLDKIVDHVFMTPEEAEKQGISDTISYGEANSVRNQLTSFEALLQHELLRLPAYVIEQKIGIYNVEDLVSKADQHLSVAERSMLDPQVGEDLKSAGRCLAFGLPTASGFHSMRAIEGCARTYHNYFRKKDAADEGMPLGPIINDLRDHLTKEGGDNNTPLGLIISTLARINNLYRKPITHPEMVVKSADDAKLIFDLAMVAISQIAEDHCSRATGPKLLTAAAAS